jgi:outer membrane murein-binding lipoprotein Lpp
MTWVKLITLVAGIVVPTLSGLLLGGWAILEKVTDGIDTNIASINTTIGTIQTDVAALRADDKTMRELLAGTDQTLRDKIFDTHVIVSENRVRLDHLQGGMNDLRGDMRLLVADRLKNPKQ